MVSYQRLTCMVLRVCGELPTLKLLVLRFYGELPMLNMKGVKGVW